jgi:hypothetical protein
MIRKVSRGHRKVEGLALGLVVQDFVFGVSEESAMFCFT